MIYSYHKDGTVPPVDEKDWVWVFGSNLSGIHGAGAAFLAKKIYEAQQGVGVGLTGHSYAIPTKDYRIRTMTLEEIRKHVDQFKDFSVSHPEMRFWVTAVGCGLAGYRDADISVMFRGASANCNFPDRWRRYLE